MNDALPETSAAERAHSRLPAAVVALGLASFFTDVGAEMIFPLLPAFIVTLGGSPVFLGVVEGLADAVSSLLKLASGYASDRGARKKTWVLAGYGLAALARPLVAFASVPFHVLLVRVTDRVGKGIRTSPRDALIADTTPHAEIGRAFGFQRALDNAGAVAGPLIATALLAFGVPMRHVFLAAGAAGFLSLVCVYAVREPMLEPGAKRDVGTAHATALPRSLSHYLSILGVFALGNSSDAFLLVRAKELGITMALIPMLWATCHVAKVLAAYFGGGLADRVARARLLASGWLVYAATYLGFGLAHGAHHAWWLFILYGFAVGLTEPVDRALIAELAPTDSQGRAFGLYNFVIGACAIPAGLLAGALWQRFGSFTSLSVSAALMATSSIALWVWDRDRVRKLRHQTR